MTLSLTMNDLCRGLKASEVSLLLHSVLQKSTIQKATLLDQWTDHEQEMEVWWVMAVNPQWRPKRMLQSTHHSQSSMSFPMPRMPQPSISSLTPLVASTMTHREASEWCRSFHHIPRTYNYSLKTPFQQVETPLARLVNSVKSQIHNNSWWGSRTRSETT